MARKPPSPKPATLRPFSISYGAARSPKPGEPGEKPRIVETPEQALTELERELAERSTLHRNLRAWLASALRLHREDRKQFPTLDHALGLRRGRGRPGRDELKIAREIHVGRKVRQSWDKLSKALKARGFGDHDSRTLQRIYARYRVQILRENIEHRYKRVDERLKRWRARPSALRKVPRRAADVRRLPPRYPRQ